jgi:thymidylate synthase (FAD)
MYDKISVELLNKMGTDSTVVDAARVSFNKIAFNYTPTQNEKLIKYLAEHNHWSPFAHCTLQFRIKAPIFVARQLQKHQVGFAWNEISRRYVDYEPTFWSPYNKWRSRAENKKQGSADELVRDNLVSQEHYDEAIHNAKLSYQLLLACGVCPEQARSILPQSIMTEWYWTGSLYGFARVCKLRLDPHAQAECREVAKEINDCCANTFPMSWKALNGTMA